MSTPADLLALALDHHRAGRIAEAETLYRRILAADSANADALHLLGVAAAQTGRAQEAVELIRRAIALRPGEAEYHANLGSALMLLTRTEEAASAYERALAANRGHVGALSQLAGIKANRGETADAADLYERLTNLTPDSFDAWFRLGRTRQDALHYEGAIAAYDSALRLNPASAEALTNKGVCLDALGDAVAAVACHRAALAVNPNFDAALLNLGDLLRRRGVNDEADLHLSRVIALRPDWSAPRISRAKLLLGRCDVDGAIEEARRLTAALPAVGDGWGMLGNALRAAGRTEEARDAFDTQRRLFPGDASAAFNAGFCRMRLGEIPQAAPLYRQRWAMAGIERRHQDVPEWRGEELGGKTLLVWEEQGLGDTLMCARFLPELARLAGRLVFESPAALAPLWPGLSAGEVILRGNPLPPADFQIAMMDIPGVLGVTPETIPWTGPYIQANPERRRRWAERLESLPGPRVGIVWAGNPKFPTDALRSPGLQTLSPLLETPGVSFVALQVGEGRRDMKDTPLPGQVLDLGPEIRDWADTAAILDNLDLLITSCTGPAHLAGAMGRPAWVMLTTDPDWRWFDRFPTTSPWYPSVRLFRQTRLGDWPPVVAAVRAALDAFGR